MAKTRRRGSIHKLGPEHYRVRVGTTDRSGRRAWVSRYVKGSLKDAERAISEILDELGESNSSTSASIGKMTLAQLVNDRYLPYLDSGFVGRTGRRYSLRTRQRYAYTLQKHIIPRLGARRLGSLTLDDMDWLINDLSAAGLTDATVADFLAVLSSAFTYAVRHHLMKDHPCEDLAQPSRTPRREVPRVDPEVVREVLALARPTRFCMAAILMLAHGLRREEALGLRWGDIDLERGEIHIRRALVAWASPGDGRLIEPVWNLPKPGRARRKVPLLPHVSEVFREEKLAQLRARLRLGTAWAGGPTAEDDQVVAREDGRPWRPDSFTRAWAAFIKDCAGTIPHLTPRDLRAAWVSNAYATIADPKLLEEWGGHSEAVARARYQRTLSEQDRQAVDRLDRVFGGDE